MRAISHIVKKSKSSRASNLLMIASALLTLHPLACHAQVPSADENKEVSRITETAVAEKLEEKAKIPDKEKDIKGYLVDNLRKAAEKIEKIYNGTNGQRDALWEILRDQADFIEKNHPDAFFDNAIAAKLEKDLRNKDSESLKKLRSALLTEILPETLNFPTDKKVAAEFTAIMTASLDDSIRAKAAQLGIINKAKDSSK